MGAQRRTLNKKYGAKANLSATPLVPKGLLA
jgi:hypothetical protein